MSAVGSPGMLDKEQPDEPSALAPNPWLWTLEPAQSRRLLEGVARTVLRAP
jgi:hypothetical protein